MPGEESVRRWEFLGKAQEMNGSGEEKGYTARKKESEDREACASSLEILTALATYRKVIRGGSGISEQRGEGAVCDSRQITASMEK